MATCSPHGLLVPAVFVLSDPAAHYQVRRPVDRKLTRLSMNDNRGVFEYSKEMPTDISLQPARPTNFSFVRRTVSPDRNKSFAPSLGNPDNPPQAPSSLPEPCSHIPLWPYTYSQTDDLQPSCRAANSECTNRSATIFRLNCHMAC